MGTLGAGWKTVLAYPPISNGQAEQMVGTTMQRVARVVTGIDLE